MRYEPSDGVPRHIHSCANVYRRPRPERHTGDHAERAAEYRAVDRATSSSSDADRSGTHTIVTRGHLHPGVLAGTDWERIPTTRHVAALTFDAGANADGVPSILATLHAEGVPAAFFLTGDFLNEFPSAARQIATSERVGNHSMMHPDFTNLTTAQINNELARARQAIQGVTGADPRPLFRFPFGARDAATIRAVNAAGYVAVRWTVDTLGWEGTSGGITAQTVYDRAVGALQPGEIVLMHCGSNPTDHTTLDANAFDRIIQTLKTRGYGSRHPQRAHALSGRG